MHWRTSFGDNAKSLAPYAAFILAGQSSRWTFFPRPGSFLWSNASASCQLCSLQSHINSVYNVARSCCNTSFGWSRSSANVSMSYPKIIAAICEQLRHRYGTGDAPAVLRRDDVAGQILQCQAAMPDFLRSGMRMLTWVFDYSGLITSGSRFHRMPTELQRHQLDVWANSRY